MNIPKPTLATFAKSVKWQVSKAFLKKLGSQPHKIEIASPISGPYRVPFRHEMFKETSAYKYINRTLELGYIGVLCSSNTAPCIREILINVEISDASPITFKGDFIVREGFDEDDVYGPSKQYTNRIDYTKLMDSMCSHTELLKLNQGSIHYPFRGARSVLTINEMDKLYLDGNYSDIEKGGDVTKIENAYKELPNNLEVTICMLLDNSTPLAYQWDNQGQCFVEAFFNASVQT